MAPARIAPVCTCSPPADRRPGAGGSIWLPAENEG